MKWSFSICVILIGIFSFLSCKKDPDSPVSIKPNGKSYTLNLPEQHFSYADLDLPDYIADDFQLEVYAFNNIPSSNYTTDEGSTLGRVLFYDTRLSADNTVSCATCHFQENAFADPNVSSLGIDGQFTTRNSMSLMNMRYNLLHFWDMRTFGLEAQVLQPIEDPREMNSNLEELVTELSVIPDYPPLFYDAFGDSTVTEENISRALSQFLRSMVSFDSKFDEGQPIDFANFTELELHGRNTFYSAQTRCNQCHTGYNFFTRLEPAMNGLESMPLDSGYFNATQDPVDLGKFKIVTLRNVELTSPYMHDGRFETLEEVIDHYNSNISPHPNLDERLTQEYENGATPLEMNLTDYDKEALVAFLKTLTDHTIATDVRFSDPFVVE